MGHFGGDILWAVISDIQPRIRRTADTLTQKGLANSNAKLWPCGSVIVSTGATIGEVGIADAPLATKQGITGLCCNDAVLPEYLAACLRLRRDLLERLSQGSTFREIRPPTLLRLRLLLPPLPEQRRIAEILDTLDEAIRKAEQLIAKLRQVKQGLLHNLLTRGIDENGELRDPARHPEQFKGSPCGAIPVSWKAVSLEDISAAPICYGIVQAGAFHPGGPFVLTIGDLAGDFRSQLHRTSPQIDHNYARSRTVAGDLLISVKGTIGRVAVVPAWYEGNISRDLARVRTSPGVVPAFVRHYLDSPIGQRRLELAVVGTTRAEISIGVLKQFLVPVAHETEQREIVRRIDAAAHAVVAEVQNVGKLRGLKAGLSEDFLTGRIRVTKLLGEKAA